MKKINIKGPIVPNSVKWIYDIFDIEATSPQDVANGLDTSDDVELEINSGGGSVFDASEIYTALRKHDGKVTANIVGLAASAASVIAMASDNLSMSPTSQMMIHNASITQSGNRNDMQHIKEVLSNVDQTIANAYKQKSGIDDKELLEMMDKETWLTPDQAKEKGLVDSIMFEELGVSASLNMDQTLPQEVIDKVRNMKDTFYPENNNQNTDTVVDDMEKMQAKLNLLKLRKEDD